MVDTIRPPVDPTPPAAPPQLIVWLFSSNCDDATVTESVRGWWEGDEEEEEGGE